MTKRSIKTDRSPLKWGFDNLGLALLFLSFVSISCAQKKRLSDEPASKKGPKTLDKAEGDSEETGKFIYPTPIPTAIPDAEEPAKPKPKDEPINPTNPVKPVEPGPKKDDTKKDDTKPTDTSDTSKIKAGAELGQVILTPKLKGAMPTISFVGAGGQKLTIVESETKISIRQTKDKASQPSLLVIGGVVQTIDSKKLKKKCEIKGVIKFTAPKETPEKFAPQSMKCVVK